MSTLFYPKLAAQNLRKNARTWLPYLITCVFTVAMFYIMNYLLHDDGLTKIHGADMISFNLSMGVVIISIFAVIFLFYTNSFLVKRRKKEFGVFNILGMEKRHLFKMMAFETLYTAVLALGLGLTFGMLLSKLMHLLLLRMLHFDVMFGFSVSAPAVTATLALFGAIFLLTLLSSLRQVHIAKPVDLLRGGQTGEREPKTRWILAALGVLLLAAGYYIALTTANPIQLLSVFFLAVLLVILGTYCLFTAGSVVLLKLLRRNKRYYYKTRHFISVSGMLYRMKQNAVGLSNICVLVTMVLVMVSSTASLYIGMQDALLSRYAREIGVTLSDYTQETGGIAREHIKSVLSARGLTASGLLDYRFLSFIADETGNEFTASDSSTYSLDDMRTLCFIPQSDYNAMTGDNVSLDEDETLVFGNRRDYLKPLLTVYGKTFTVRRTDADFSGFHIGTAYNDDMIGTYFVVVRDMAVIGEITALWHAADSTSTLPLRHYIGFDLGVSDELCMEVAAQIRDDIAAALQGSESSVRVESRAANRYDFYGLYGGLFFLGIFLGVLFVIAAVLIIYYKQISEGFDDKERFAIMQKVGLSRRDIKRSIRGQILTMFFLPLGAACVHIAFAFPALTRMLALLNLHNTPLFLVCTIACIVVFALFYAIVYVLTARVYYGIVGEQ